MWCDNTELALYMLLMQLPLCCNNIIIIRECFAGNWEDNFQNTDFTKTISFKKLERFLLTFGVTVGGEIRSLLCASYNIHILIIITVTLYTLSVEISQY